MDYERIKSRLRELGQIHLLEYYDELNEKERKALLKDIENTNFSVVGNLCKTQTARGEITPVSAVTVDDIKKQYAEFEKTGLEVLKKGKVAAVLLAGGQGSRLGFNGPKGMFNIGVTRKLSIFEQQMNNIAEVTAKTGESFHLFVMTSAVNNDATVEFFESNDFFGYPKDKIHFYMQEVAPACDYNGKVFLDSKCRVSLAPNGNGGWYSSLVKSGLADIIKREGIEWLNIYSVDNVLQKICDPVFIGATISKNFRCGAKVVRKVNSGERVGVLCNEDGRPTVIEYYELPAELAEKREGGELVYCYGVILNYLFNVDDLNAMLVDKLPYHLAEKAIAHMENGERVTPQKPCGYKFETLVVDMIKKVDSCLAYEVEREKEFAPVKNATGTDSVESARALLERNGVTL